MTFTRLKTIRGHWSMIRSYWSTASQSVRYLSILCHVLEKNHKNKYRKKQTLNTLTVLLYIKGDHLLKYANGISSAFYSVIFWFNHFHIHVLPLKMCCSRVKLGPSETGACRIWCRMKYLQQKWARVVIGPEEGLIFLTATSRMLLYKRKIISISERQHEGE